MNFEWKVDIASILTLIAIIVALFGRDFVAWLKRPKINLLFQKDDESFFHKLDLPLFEHGGLTHYSNGINCLFKVSNTLGKLFFLQTEKAKNVEAKITYIYFENEKYTYHPTNLNWSGGKEAASVNIISGSHHFLDFIRFYNYEKELLIDDPKNPSVRKTSAIHPNEAPVVLPSNKSIFNCGSLRAIEE